METAPRSVTTVSVESSSEKQHLASRSWGLITGSGGRGEWGACTLPAVRRALGILVCFPVTYSTISSAHSSHPNSRHSHSPTATVYLRRQTRPHRRVGSRSGWDARGQGHNLNCSHNLGASPPASSHAIVGTATAGSLEAPVTKGARRTWAGEHSPETGSPRDQRDRAKQTGLPQTAACV